MFAGRLKLGILERSVLNRSMRGIASIRMIRYSENRKDPWDRIALAMIENAIWTTTTLSLKERHQKIDGLNLSLFHAVVGDLSPRSVEIMPTRSGC